MDLTRDKCTRVQFTRDKFTRDELAREGLPSGSQAPRNTRDITHSQESTNLDFNAFTRQLKEQRRQVRKKEGAGDE